MFLITVIVAANTAPVLLGFKGEDTAQKAVEAFDAVDTLGGGKFDKVKIIDDFGQQLNLRAQPLAFVVQDMAQCAEVDIERGIYQMRLQAKTMERSNSDPAIAAARRSMQQGPAVFSPMGGNMNGRGF